MSEKPILFSGEMVKAILAGRKTQTRRVINPQPDWRNVHPSMIEDVAVFGVIADGRSDWRCPYGQPGDQLWVRETYKFGHAPNDDRGQGIAMYADGDYKLHPDLPTDRATWCREWKKKPSIFMPRWASRINLLIKNVRVERLQEISEADAIAEGIEIPSVLLTGSTYPNLSYEIDGPSTIVDYYHQLWDTINAKRGYPWASNPWVWVVEFDSVTKGVTHGVP